MLWIKSLHIIAVVSWFAGLLYLPRLFVYHADAADAASRARFALMESRLYWRIMTPAMAVAVGSGMTLLGYGFVGGWLAVKLLCVALLLVFHASCAYYMRLLKSDRPDLHPRAKFFRLYNEIPTVLLIIIVIMVVVKPW